MVMRTSLECDAKAVEMDALALHCTSEIAKGDYGTMAGHWRDLAKRAAWQEAFTKALF
jgi:hypothetical protein